MSHSLQHGRLIIHAQGMTLAVWVTKPPNGVRPGQDGFDDDPIPLPAPRSTMRAPSPSFHKPPPLHPDSSRTTTTPFVYIAPLSTTRQQLQHTTLSIQVNVDAQAFSRSTMCFSSCITLYPQSCILLLIQTCTITIDGRQRLANRIRAEIDDQDIGIIRLG